MDKKVYSPVDILEAREKRAEFQKELIEKFKETLIVCRVNYPGLCKNNYVSNGIMDITTANVISLFKDKILYKEISNNAEGPIFTLVVKCDAVEVKRLCIGFEEKHELGRFLDIDVYDNKYHSISRTELGLDFRKCFICDEPAVCCVRSRKHNEKEIIDFINKSYLRYIEKN